MKTPQALNAKFAYIESYHISSFQFHRKFTTKLPAFCNYLSSAPINSEKKIETVT